MISSSIVDVRLRVATALAASKNPRLRNVRVDLDDNALCLSGRVPSFYQKQMAQELVRAIDDQVQVRNQLQVEQTVS